LALGEERSLLSGGVCIPWQVTPRTGAYNGAYMKSCFVKNNENIDTEDEIIVVFRYTTKYDLELPFKRL